MFIKDPNSQGIILLGIKDSRSILYFPSNCNQFSLELEISKYWGLFFKIDPRMVIEEQIVQTIKSEPYLPKDIIKDLNICSSFRSKIYVDSTPTSLYLVLTEHSHQILPEYKQISSIIKDLPNNKNRISYTFIVQYLSSLGTDELSALEVCDSDLGKVLLKKNN